jgi:hypothetical protein
MVRYLTVLLIVAASSVSEGRVVHAASGAWCAIYTRGSENCGYSSYAQCMATVRGLSAICQPNPFPGTNFGRGGTWTEGRGSRRTAR